MNILAGNSEMYLWTEKLFGDVSEEIKREWDVVNSPISTDIGVINIHLKSYQTKISTVGDIVDIKIDFKNTQVEIRTYYKNKTLLFKAKLDVSAFEVSNSEFTPNKK